MSLNNTPALNHKDVISYINDKYDMQVSCEKLPGERDQNFLVRDENERKYVLKISNASEDINFLKAQNSIIRHIHKEISICPDLIPDNSGSDMGSMLSPSGDKYYVRLYTYLEGITMGSLKNHSDELLTEMGEKLGEMDKVLAGYKDKAFNRSFDWDLAEFELIIERHRDILSDVEACAFVDATLQDYKDIVLPLKDRLRKSIIHNDVNDYNVIIGAVPELNDRKAHIKGFIDFGDMVYSYTIGNLAVAIAYAMLEKSEPLSVAAKIIRGYNASFKPDNDEIEVLYTLSRMRLCISICMAAYQQRQRPDDEYLIISQQAIRNTIPRLQRIHNSFAVTIFREACGMSPDSHHKYISEHIANLKDKSFPVLGKALNTKNCYVFNLGVDSSLISGDTNRNSEENLTAGLNEILHREGRTIGVGRYDEARILYSSPVFQKEQFRGDEDRTIHLGIDLFVPEGSSVYCPLDAVVHLFANNSGELDYGHMIILRHGDGKNTFYTLYGHLSSDSIDGLKPGAKIDRGEEFARIGSVSENGGWSPHLHFQIITDLLDYAKDFPGVCKPWERESWKLFSPDPNILLGIPEECFPSEEIKKEQSLLKRKSLLGKNLSLAYKDHIKVVRGWKQYLFDEKGQKYLDAYNNVPHIGHCHPEIAEAASRQMKLLNTNTRYLSDSPGEYAELLVSTMPDPLNVCYFLNSASEANELALRLAFNYTGRKDIIVLEGAYHGHTNSMIDISPYKHDGPGGKGAPAWVHTAPVADCYRGEFKYNDADAGQRYALRLKEMIDRMMGQGKAPAAFIAETCPSVGGQIIFPEGYLKNVYKYIRESGGICIADEVQTSYGRMGTGFYAFEDQLVVPDIVVLGKPIGNGHPIAAVVTSSSIADAFDNGMEFFSTFGGNTVSSLIGKNVLEIVLRDKMQQHAFETGEYLLKRFHKLKDKFEIIGDIRGSGLFFGIELVRDRETLEAATEEASWLADCLRRMNILTGTDGPLHNVLKIRPPMPFSKDNACVLADRLEFILENDAVFKL